MNTVINNLNFNFFVLIGLIIIFKERYYELFNYKKNTKIKKLKTF